MFPILVVLWMVVSSIRLRDNGQHIISEVALPLEDQTSTANQIGKSLPETHVFSQNLHGTLLGTQLDFLLFLRLLVLLLWLFHLWAMFFNYAWLGYETSCGRWLILTAGEWLIFLDSLGQEGASFIRYHECLLCCALGLKLRLDIMFLLLP